MLYQETLICILLSLNLCSGIIDLSDTDYCELCTEKKSHTACQDFPNYVSPTNGLRRASSVTISKLPTTTVVQGAKKGYPSDKPPGPCKRRSLSKDDKVEVLRKHNELRARAARGEDTQPQASDMMRLRWDMELEAVAARWVLQCKDSYDKCRDSTRFPVGQNIAWRKLDMDIPMDLITMLQGWYNEIMDFSKDGIKSYKFNPTTTHYTQLVWAKTTLVGCALAERGSAPGIEFTLICNYGPSGNVAGEPVYQEGDAASACPKGSTRDKTYPGLCATSQEDFEDMKLHPSIRLKAPASAAPMPLTVLLALAMVFRKCWDLLCAVTAT